MVVSRGTRGRAYTLLTPGNHYMSRLPALPGVAFYKLVSPRQSPARFGEYLLAFGEEPIRSEIPAGFENFFFGLSGAVGLRWRGASAELAPRTFAYLPAGEHFTIEQQSGAPARILWLKRRYETAAGVPEPGAMTGAAGALEALETAVPGLRRRELIAPLDPSYDFNISLMSFAPGVALHQIEIHDEEHGLYMTAGGGTYHLDGDEHEVRAADFIYMAPYCPQGFVAGPEGAEYLLYKDVYRDGF